MLVNEIINPKFTPLVPTDTITHALTIMEAWSINRLPVIEARTGKVIGQIRRHLLDETGDKAMAVSGLEMEEPAVVFEQQHIFEAARMMHMHDERLMPVVDFHMVWQGIVERKDVLEAFTGLLNITVPGSVITVEQESGDNTLSEIVYLIEAEEARILGVSVETPSEPGDHFRISFKLNVRETSGISSSLRRHGYSVSSESHSELLQFDISDRADELMRYLDV